MLVNILTKDTRDKYLQHASKRPLRRTKRRIIGQQMSKDLASNWQRENMSDIEFGSTSPLNLYQNDVLRKMKQEYKDNYQGTKLKNPIESLVEFKRNSGFSGSIHNIGVDPFFIHYWSSANYL